MSFYTNDDEARLEYKLPLWLKEALRQMSARDNKPMNEILSEAVVKVHPELIDVRVRRQGSVVKRLLGHRKSTQAE